MAQEVEYLYGTESIYNNLTNKSPMTFYKTEKNLYLGSWKLTNAEEINTALERVGDLSALNTSNKTSLVNAINEVLASSGSGGGTVSTATSTAPGIVKLYNSLGENSDGTMTQAAIKAELNKKAEVDGSVTDETLSINI